MNMMKLLVVPCALAVVSLATAEEQQIEVSAEASPRGTRRTPLSTVE